MHAIIISRVRGEPRSTTIDSHLEPNTYPAIDAESTAYLDGKQIYHGTAADRIEVQTQEVSVQDHTISTWQEPGLQTHATEWYADLEAGWIGVDSSKGDWLVSHLAMKHGVQAYETFVNLDRFAEYLRDEHETATAWHTARSQSYDDDGDSEKTTINYHDAATIAETARGTNVQLGFEYFWGDVLVRGTIAKSGYAAIYSHMTVEEFARWVADELLPFCYTEAFGQVELGHQDSSSEVES